MNQVDTEYAEKIQKSTLPYIALEWIVHLTNWLVSISEE
jgi:hypothetical protein